MELVAYFEQFLKDEVNLNQNRIDTLNQKKITLTNFIKNSDEFKDLFISMKTQGSLAQKTIIKPANGSKEFDADFLLLLKENEDWEPKNYINELYNLFRSSSTYKDIVHRNKRCVLIDYAGDFHIDIVPCIVTDSDYLICNRTENTFEIDKPLEFKEWFFDKHNDSYKSLIKSVRLFKYLRDIKVSFTIKSILLNTLLGNEVGSFELKSGFKNIPTSFYTLFDRLNTYLQNNSYLPTVPNPVLSEENLAERNWDQTKYNNFRNQIKSYLEKVKDAYEETDKKESVKKWKIVFGEKFPSELKESKTNQSIAAIASLAPEPYASKL
jgi:hypothetical protein